MKKVISSFMLLLISASLITAQTSKVKNNPVGKWKYEAPTAGEGYTSGNIQISFADNKYSAAVTFPGSDYVLPCQKTRIENDTVKFSVIIEENVVMVSLKQQSDSKMTGKAVYVEGVIPLTLTRDVQNN